MLIRLLLGTAILLLSSLVQASMSASPNPNVDGNFTVSWDSHGGTDWYELRQRINGGGQVTYTIPATSTSKTFTNKPSATYTYELYYCEDFGHPDEYECYNTGYGQTDVVVQPLPWPEPDHLSEQLQYDYETRRGDINGDGRQDIFIDRTTATESGNGAIEHLILQQTPTGSFTSVVPTSAQVSIASSWTSVAVELFLQDFNMDGFVDIATQNISTVIAGTIDQIVFSSAQVLINRPTGTTAIDSELQDFMAETANWLADPNYFENNKIWIPEIPGYWDWEYVCQFQWGGQGWDCGWEQVWIEGTPGYWSYDHFNQDALTFCSTMAEIEAAGGMTPGSPQASTIQQVYDKIFGGGITDGIFASGSVIVDFPPIDTTSDTPWWRSIRAAFIWLITLQIAGDTPQELPLYRVVEIDELNDIVSCHCFRTLEGQQEVKQFWKNEVDGMWYGQIGIKNIDPDVETRVLLRIMVSRQVYNLGVPGAEPNTTQGWLAYSGPTLDALNADIWTKDIQQRYIWTE